MGITISITLDEKTEEEKESGKYFISSKTFFEDIICGPDLKQILAKQFDFKIFDKNYL